MYDNRVSHGVDEKCYGVFLTYFDANNDNDRCGTNHVCFWFEHTTV